MDGDVTTYGWLSELAKLSGAPAEKVLHSGPRVRLGAGISPADWRITVGYSLVCKSAIMPFYYPGEFADFNSSAVMRPTVPQNISRGSFSGSMPNLAPRWIENMNEFVLVGNMENCVITLDESWVDSLKKKVEEIECSQPWRKGPCTIFRVPRNIREVNPIAYEPKVVSLGPYHRGEPRLKAMDEFKWCYLKNILRRNEEVGLEDYLKEIKALEIRARSSYSEAIDMGSNEFVEMLLLDSCFVVELLLVQRVESGPVLSTKWTPTLVGFDMLVLENQIPFFVAEKLFELVSLSNKGRISNSLSELALDFFDDLFPINIRRVPLRQSASDFHHFLHLFHCSIVRSTMSESNLTPFGRRELSRSPPLPITESIPCATRLDETGIKFKKKKNAESFLDITFCDGVMEVAPLHIYGETNSLLRNLIAFEHCYPDAGSHVATYVVFIDCMIDSSRDVWLLQQRGILVNSLGNNADSIALFDEICKDVVVADFEASYLAQVFKDVNRHCDSKWNGWRAKLMHDYFSNPWAIISLIAALILLFLTAAQAVFAMVAYYWPPS